MTSITEHLPAISRQSWDMKYRLKSPDGEPIDLTIESTWARVARALAAAEKPEEQEGWAQRFYNAMEGFRFIPAGRILAGAGTARDVTLLNCFTMGIIPDSLDGIFTHLREAALTMKQGGGIGYDFSTLRPKGARVKGVDADASGPLSFMDVWNAMCKTLMSAGTRRGAMMATMRCDHPDILEFVKAKQEKGRLTQFNMSVLCTDAFMEAVKNDGEWHLEFGEGYDRYRYTTVAARQVWDAIMRSTYDHAEPGVIFIDQINRRNNLYWCDTIATTNPCGEKPMGPYSSCNLGSINLASLVRNPFTIQAFIDANDLDWIVPTAIRMLDNVYDVSKFPLPQQAEEGRLKRQIGLGVTGLANALAMCGLRYGTPVAAQLAQDWMQSIEERAYFASSELAAEKGPFPLFNRDKYLDGEHIKTLSPRIKEAIAEKGMRNSHLMSVAPTGTISLLAGNVSGGIEPPFAYQYTRKVLQADGSRTEEAVEDFAYALFREMHGGGAPAGWKLPPCFVTAQDLTPDEHLLMLAAVQERVDSSISKCVAKGTRILTRNGLIPIEDLGEASIAGEFASAKKVEVLSGEGRWKRVTSHYFAGRQKTIRIRFDNGAIIEGSERHKIRTVDGWRCLGELSVGEYAQIRRTIPFHEASGSKSIDTVHFDHRSKKMVLPTQMSVDLALICGLLCADGHLEESSGLISICKKDAVVIDAYRNAWDSVFPDLALKYIIDKRNGLPSLNATSRSLVKWFRSLIGYRANNKHIPEQILLGSVDEQRAFIRGVTADGYRSKDNCTVLYEGKSQTLASQLYSIAVALSMEPRAGRKAVLTHGYDVYNVSVYGYDECLQEHKNSSVSGPAKFLVPIPHDQITAQMRRDNSIARKWNFENTTLTFASTLERMGLQISTDVKYCIITSIETSETDLYDIEVEDDHSYLVDGIVSHNTINLPSEISFDDFKDVYRKAYDMGCKSCTTYRPNDVTGSVLSVDSERLTLETVVPRAITNALKNFSYACPDLDQTEPSPEVVAQYASEWRAIEAEEALDKIHHHDVPIFEEDDEPEDLLPVRPDSLPGRTYKVRWTDGVGNHAYYVTINDHVESKAPFEIFINSKCVEHQAWITALTRMVSAVFRRGGDLRFVAEELKAVVDPKGGAWIDGRYVPSLPALIGEVIERHMSQSPPDQGGEGVNHVQTAYVSGAPIDLGADTKELREELVKKYGEELMAELDQLTASHVDAVNSSFKEEPYRQCPKCGSLAVKMQEGCEECLDCGWSRCG